MFRSARYGRISEKTTGTQQEMQSGTFEKYGRIAKAVGELKNARKISVRFLIVGIIHSVNIFLYGESVSAS